MLSIVDIVKKRLLGTISSSGCFVAEGGQAYMKFDSIRFEQDDKNITVLFFWKNEEIHRNVAPALGSDMTSTLLFQTPCLFPVSVE